ncbi:type 1 fimbrial protein, partial [Klebsiella pneumoniae]
MSFLTLLRRVALTLLFTLLPAASGWACTPVFVRG